MKKQCTILMLGLFVAVVFSSVLWAEQRPGQGEVRGSFVQLAEREVGEREYLAIVIKPVESDDHITVLVPRNEDFLHAARTLQKGDKVEIGYVVEEGQRWLKTIGIERVRRIEAERRLRDVEERRDVRRPRREDVEERERPRRDAERGKADELQGVFRRLWARLDRMERELKQLIAVRMERMERELKELRAENARLRRQLQMRERESSTRGREREVRERRAPEGRREAREREEGREREERDLRRAREGREKTEERVREEREEVREEREKAREEREKARREREEVRREREEVREEREEVRDREESER